MPPQQPGQPQPPFSYRPAGFPAPQQPVPQSYPPYKKKVLTRPRVIVVGVAVVVGVIVLIVLTSHKEPQKSTLNDPTRADINNLRVSLQSYYAEGNAAYASYPTLAQFNDAGWRSTNMTGVDELTMSPSGSTSGLISGKPTESAYSYVPSPAGCTNTAASPCTSYSLSGILASGKIYTQKSEY